MGMPGCGSSSSYDDYYWKKYTETFNELEKYKKKNERKIKVKDVLEKKSCDNCKYKKIVDMNPDPSKFTVLDIVHDNGFVILKIKYHNCSNYEGKKILVYKDTTYNEILYCNDHIIDPHFSGNKEYISPIARFEPTAEGMKMAKWFIENYEV